MSPQSFEFIRTLVQRRAAIVLDANKGYLVQARLSPLTRRLGLQTLDQLVLRLQQYPESRLSDQVVDAMTTNETTFFRDTVPFEALRDEIIPALLRRRAATRTLSIWCAACSTGQEPYSIAMLLQEHFRSYLQWNIRLLASDISHRALSQATEGSYGELEIARGLPSNLRDKYFQRSGDRWYVTGQIRSMVDFRLINLAGEWPPLARMDLILLRNVMVYFDVETKRQILQRVRRVLATDGNLLLGAAETTLLIDNAFTRVPGSRFSYYQLRPVDTRPQVDGDEGPGTRERPSARE